MTRVRFQRPTLILAVLLAAVTVLFFISRPEKRALKEIPRSQLALRDGSWYCIGEPTPFTGVMVEAYPGGERKSRVEVVQGRLDGLCERWYTNGQPQVLEHFREGISHGLRTKWHPNGSKMSEVQIVEGKLEGTFRRWNSDGSLAEEIQMANGEANGVSRGYYPSGFLRTEARLRNGDVLDQKFWKDGELRAGLAAGE